MGKKPTKKQQIQWLKEGRCHVCGSNQEHTHPNWMWLTNTPPKTDDPEIKEQVDFQRKISLAKLGVIIGGKVTDGDKSD